jgi:hypothetical protein
MTPTKYNISCPFCEKRNTRCKGDADIIGELKTGALVYMLLGILIRGARILRKLFHKDILRVCTNFI